MMESVAILGAGGFIGNRAVEMLYLGGHARVVPITRRAAGLSLPCRFDLPVRIADAFDERALAAAFSGCDSAVIAIAGDPRTIVESVVPIYRAAKAAGLRRIVYLSTASVHGQSPRPATDEASPLSDRQKLPYNNAKVRAERQFLACREKGSVEIVMLRPGIVHGPRSHWTGGLADELIAGEASLVDGGQGICNAIYVDNVVHAIRLALTAPGVDREAFLIGDVETLSWRDFYRPIAEALGIDVDALPRPPASAAVSGPPLAERIRESAAFRMLPAPLRAALKAAYAARREPKPVGPRAPLVTLEQAMLHGCAYKLPWTKARALLGYQPLVSFEEGCRRSIAWLAFAGYPVRVPEAADLFAS
jgi:nucleoside-diphosphate-sugar epimerase